MNISQPRSAPQRRFHSRWGSPAGRGVPGTGPGGRLGAAHSQPRWSPSTSPTAGGWSR